MELRLQLRNRPPTLAALTSIAPFTTIGAVVAEATLRLDAGEGRRVGEARDRWARRDQRRLAQIKPAGGGERRP
jgi:hypothetical protein